MSSWAQSAFNLTQALPWLITLALSAFSIGKDRNGRWGTELAMSLYIKWSWVLQAFLWILESNYQIVRPHPYDPNTLQWAYPCEVAFWCFSLVSYILSYVVLWRIKLPATYWALMLIFAFMPPAVLVWFMYNTWSEILSSILLAVGLTIPFVIWMRYALDADTVSMMLRTAPWTWLGAIDTHLRTIEEIDDE